MTNRFNEYVSTALQCTPLLPLTHTCDGFSFRDIAKVSQISTKHCLIFDELLIYFFYGRPAYRPSSWSEENARSSFPFMPCSIVLKHDTGIVPKRIAPFDTGACHDGRYDNYLHPGMHMEDFLLTPSLDMPPRVVGVFFGSNSNYFVGNPLSIRVPPLQFEIQSYCDIISHKATSFLDDRGSAIEIQSGQSLFLSSDNVLFVVLPKVFLGDKDIRESVLNKWKATIGAYTIHQGTLSELMGKVYYQVEKYLRKQKYL